LNADVEKSGKGLKRILPSISLASFSVGTVVSTGYSFLTGIAAENTKSFLLNIQVTANQHENGCMYIDSGIMPCFNIIIVKRSKKYRRIT